MFLSKGISFGYVFPLTLGDGGGTKFLVQATQGEVTPCHHSTSVAFCFCFFLECLFSFTALHNTNAYNKPGCSFLTFSQSSVLTCCGCLSRIAVEFEDLEMLVGCNSLSPSQGPNRLLCLPCSLLYPSAAHQLPRCETAMVSACSLTLPPPHVRRNLACCKPYKCS